MSPCEGTVRDFPKGENLKKYDSIRPNVRFYAETHLVQRLRRHPFVWERTFSLPNLKIHISMDHPKLGALPF